MAEDSEIRRRNFQAWARHLNGGTFSPTKVHETLKFARPSQWSDLYHGRKRFGEKLAREIEIAAGLVRLSLDDPGGTSPEPFTADLLEAVAQRSQDDRLMLENLVRVAMHMKPLAALPPDPGKRRKAA